MKKLICGICLALLPAGAVWAADLNGIQVETLAKTGSSWNESRLPGYPDGPPEITILRIKIPPGAQLPRHNHPVINAGVLLHGELTVISEDNRVLHLKAGEPIVEVVRTWHHGKNEGRETAEILVFYAGTAATPITVTQ